MPGNKVGECVCLGTRLPIGWITGVDDNYSIHSLQLSMVEYREWRW